MWWMWPDDAEENNIETLGLCDNNSQTQEYLDLKKNTNYFVLK